MEVGRLCRLHGLCADASEKAKPTPLPNSRPVVVDGEREYEALDGKTMDKYHRDFVKKYGGAPLFDEEPTRKQLAQVKALLDNDDVPYVDFSTFGTRASGLEKKTKHAALRLGADGTWRREILPGPANFDQWHQSWRCLRVTLMLLDAARPCSLDAYEQRVRRLAAAFDWDLVVAAEDACRKHEFERLRRKHDRKRGRADRGREDRLPWGRVLRDAAGDETYWATAVKEPQYLRSAGRHGHPANGDSKTAAHATGAPVPRKEGRKPQPGHPKSGKTSDGKEVCYAWNKGGCSADKCPQGRVHICQKCHGQHRKGDCPKKA